MVSSSVKAPVKGGGHTRENDIRWTPQEWADVARLAVRRIVKDPTEPLGEVLNTVQKAALPSRRWKPLDELSQRAAQTKFYNACKSHGYELPQRPPRVAGVKAVREALRWTERELLLVLRRYEHLQKVHPKGSGTERLNRAQELELPPDRRYQKRQALSSLVMVWDKRAAKVRHNLWLLDKVPFYANATTYEEAQGQTPMVVKEPAPPAPTATEVLGAALPPLPPPVSPAALAAPLPASGPALDGLASGIADALNAYIATRDAAITAHVMQSIASGPIANAIAAHITHTLAGTIADAVNAVVSQVVPRIVAAELAASVSHVASAAGAIKAPAAVAPTPAGEPPPAVEVLPALVAEPVPTEKPPKAPKGPKHDPSPVPDPTVVKRLRVDLVGTERMGAVRAVMGHLNGAGRFVDLHAISQDQSNYHPNKGTPVVVFNNFGSHALTNRIRACGADMRLVGGGMLGAAKAIKAILAERGYIQN